MKATRFTWMFLLVLTLACALCCASALAEDAWTCPSCSAENTGKFCTQCGTAKPLAEYPCPGCGSIIKRADGYRFCPSCGYRLDGATPTPTVKPTLRPTVKPTARPTVKPTATVKPRTFKITKVTASSNGNVTVRWSDSTSRAPYKVRYQYYVDSNHSSEKQRKQLTWIGDESTKGTSTVLNWLIPGKKYWIIVTDKDDVSTWYAYKPSSVSRYPEFGISVSMSLQKTRGQKVTDLDKFSAKVLEKQDSAIAYGAYIKLTYSRLAKARKYVCRVSMTTPDGSVYAVHLDEAFDLPAGRSYTYWKFFQFDSFFGNVIEQYGYVPIGKYTWTIYFNNYLVNSRSFNVEQ